MQKNNNVITDRFLLKELTGSDASQEYLNWLNDNETGRYISYKNNNISALSDFIIEKHNDKDCLFWGIFSGTEHIGNIKYERLASHSDVITMGILIGKKDWHGKGVATEVIKATIAFLQKNLNISTINLGVKKNNIVAIKAYKKIGFEIIKNGYFNFDNSAVEMIYKIS